MSERPKRRARQWRIRQCAFHIRLRTHKKLEINWIHNSPRKVSSKAKLFADSSAPSIEHHDLADSTEPVEFISAVLAMAFRSMHI